MDFKPVACKHDSSDVLSYVMDIALYSRDDGFRFFASLVICVHERLQNGHGIPHNLCGFHHLGKEHLSVSEQRSDGLHSGHQRPLDDVQGTAISLHRLVEVGLEIL